MNIYLSDIEIENLEIIYLGKKVLDNPKYIQARDKAWVDFTDKAKLKGKEIWNGRLYAFDGISQEDLNHPKIYLSEIEYKDRIFKKVYGFENIKRDFTPQYLTTHCGLTCILRTIDRKYVVAKKIMTLNLKSDQYAHVSGNLNIDEMEVHNIHDLRLYMQKELEEETALNVDTKRLKLLTIANYNTFLNFIFTYNLNISANEVESLNKDTEFQSFEAKTKEEILTLEGISDFEYIKSLLE